MNERASHHAVEQAARESYGRLVAWAASRCGDVALAEDAVADALQAALQRWPVDGIPDRPEAWLLTTARRKMIDRIRRGTTRSNAADRLRVELTEAADRPFRDGLPDRRLALMLVCTHPEIQPRDRTPLMLQAVLGLDAARIAAALLVKPATLAQRLVRAKRQIREAGLSFEVPSPAVLPERVGHLLDAIYAAYGTGFDEAPGSEASRGLTSEALWLARLLVDLLPGHAECLGLYGLLCHVEARSGARRDDDGAFVPLLAQDPARWDATLLLEGEKAVWLASRMGRPGPYQLEAAIQSHHADRRRTGTTDHASIHRLYCILVDRHASVGATVGLAASHGHVGQAEQGLALLDTLPQAVQARHQPVHAVRADLLARLGRAEAAHRAYTTAAGLTADPSVRRWLLARRHALDLTPDA